MAQTTSQIARPRSFDHRRHHGHRGSRALLKGFTTARAVLAPYPWTVVAALYLLTVELVATFVGADYTALGTLAVVPVLLALEWRWLVVAIASVPVVLFTSVAPFKGLHATETAMLFRTFGLAVGAVIAVNIAWSRERREATLARTRAVAENAQLAILPPVPARLGPYRFSALYRSATEEARVGGDFYKVQATPYGVRLIVADVQGKGVDAVRMSSQMMGTFREWAPRIADLEELVALLDEGAVSSADDAEFITAIIATLSDDQRLHVANCGHPAPFWFAGGERRALIPSRRTTPLGLFPDPVVDTYHLSSGDRLFFYTDGLFDTRDHYEQERVLRDAFGDLWTSGFDEALGMFLDRVEARGSRLRDDTTLILAECGSTTAGPRASSPLEGRAAAPAWFRRTRQVG